MGCEATAWIVARWERGEAVSGPEARQAADHVASCPRCAARLAGVIPLLLRDAEGPAAGPEELPEGLEEAIMERVGRTPLRRRAPARRGLGVGLAVAAALLLALGIGGGLLARLRAPAGDFVTVTFVLDAPQARSVAVVGDFSNWQSAGQELARRGADGAWAITLRLRRDRTYTYCFLVDGERWLPDPRAPESVDDGFGGVDSVLRL
jgi:hypothetical protein